MKVLGIDTATEACSAALLVDGEVFERYEVLGRGHAERLLPMVQEVLAEAGRYLGFAIAEAADAASVTAVLRRVLELVRFDVAG